MATKFGCTATALNVLALPLLTLLTKNESEITWQLCNITHSQASHNNKLKSRGGPSLRPIARAYEDYFCFARGTTTLKRRLENKSWNMADRSGCNAKALAFLIIYGWLLGIIGTCWINFLLSLAKSCVFYVKRHFFRALQLRKLEHTFTASLLKPFFKRPVRLLEWKSWRLHALERWTLDPLLPSFLAVEKEVGPTNIIPSPFFDFFLEMHGCQSFSKCERSLEARYRLLWHGSSHHQILIFCL